MKPFQKKFLDFVIKKEILRFGEFTLKSGRQSPYFFNAGLFNTGESLSFLGQSYAEAIKDSGIKFDILFGPAYKGIPLVSASAIALSQLTEENIPYCFNRKEAKDHGEGGLIVGSILEGKALIIDDVITAGTAIREVMDIFSQSKAVPAGVVVALDRQEKGQGELSAIQEIEKEFGIPVVSIITLEQIVSYIENNLEQTDSQTEKFSRESLIKLREYQSQYGI